MYAISSAGDGRFGTQWSCLCDQVSAQTRFCNMFDHLHLAAPDRLSAEWYRRISAVSNDGRDRPADVRRDARSFSTEREGNAQLRAAWSTTSASRSGNVDAAMKGDGADGREKKNRGACSKVAGTVQARVRGRPLRSRLESCRTPRTRTAPVTCVERIRIRRWRGTSIIRRHHRQNEGRLDGI